VVECRADHEGRDREEIVGHEKASTEAPTKRQKATENFMVFRLLCIQRNTDKGTLDVLHSETAMMVVIMYNLIFWLFRFDDHSSRVRVSLLI
jgi:hypothetical protein